MPNNNFMSTSWGCLQTTNMPWPGTAAMHTGAPGRGSHCTSDFADLADLADFDDEDTSAPDV